MDLGRPRIKSKKQEKINEKLQSGNARNFAKMTNDNDWEGRMGGMITVTVTELEASSFQGNFQVRQNYCVSVCI